MIAPPALQHPLRNKQQATERYMNRSGRYLFRSMQCQTGEIGKCREKAGFWTCNIFRCFHMDTGTFGLVKISQVFTWVLKMRHGTPQIIFFY